MVKKTKTALQRAVLRASRSRAERESGEPLDLHVLAGLGDGLLEELADRLVLVLDERLIEEAHLGVVLLELAFGDLRDQDGSKNI